MNSITNKYQLIDDESVFRFQQLDGLAKQQIKQFGKQYHIVSIIGSQSSGKSTLLNSIFKTDFDVLNRKKRVGQTTKGIWYSTDVPSNMIILDVQGSDSNERQQRIKIQRRNSLFALAVSHTLLINLWIQQIGLYKGSQLAILQIILELNLKLFGSEKPKQIIFVVRDYIADQQNENALRQKLFSKVQQAWQNIPKPQGKQNIKLNDLFNLQAFFLPSKVQEKEQFQAAVTTLRTFLIKNAKNKQIIKDNVPMGDFPLYMKNLWETIEADKDINLPQQKILLSNMRCHQIKKKIYEEFEEEFRDQLEKSQRKMNFQFAHNITQIVNKMMTLYDQQTTGYIKQQVQLVRVEFNNALQSRIQNSFSYQIKLIEEECLRNFTEDVNKNFIKQKNIDVIKGLKPEVIKKFSQYAEKVSYKSQWANQKIIKFTKAIDDAFEHQKQKIISDSLKDFDRSIKKQVQGMVSNAFYDKKIFCQNFWNHINKTYKEIQHKAKNSIVGLYNKLQVREKGQGSINKKISDHVDKAKFNAKQQLKTIIQMKCNDLLYYVMRHFSVDFNMDDKQIPRQWVDMKVQQITALYQNTKKKYIQLLQNFKNFNLSDLDEEQVLSKSKKMVTRSSYIDGSSANDELVKGKDLLVLYKKLEEQMKNVYEEALKKNKQVYMGSIPTWGWILFLLVAFDDILLWLKSPYLAIPITLVLIVIVLIFLFGGRSTMNSLTNNLRSAASNAVANVTTQAASSMLKRQ